MILRLLVSSTVVGVAMAACSHAVRTAPAPMHPADSSRTSRVPMQVGRYRLTRRDWIRGTQNDSAYHFTDGSPARVTVFLYAIPADVQVGPDSQSWTAREGKKFEEVQPLLVQQGVMDMYRLAFANSEHITVGNRAIMEHATAIAVRRSGSVAVDFQYLYLVAGQFLKIRATVPSEGWERTDVPTFAREMARRVATADTTRQ